MNIPVDLQGRMTGLLRSPKTVLGFFGVLVGLMGLAMVAILRLAADDPVLREYVPHVLIFCGALFAFIVLAVFITAWVNPAKLMLGEVKGEVYLQMLRLKQGDSTAGDVIENVPAVIQTSTGAQRALPGGPSTEDQSRG